MFAKPLGFQNYTIPSPGRCKVPSPRALDNEQLADP
jgi:hypothetical protein